MDLQDLMAGLAVRRTDGGGPVRICDMTEDSRTVVPGSLFIARRGTKVDGSRFVPGAIAAGAAAVLTDDPGVRAPAGSGVAMLLSDDVSIVCARMAERFYGSPTSTLRLVGVTGTNGKTTTTWLIHAMLNAVRARCGLVGTVLVDDGREVAPSVLTTPPALELSRTFATMVENGCVAASMETSSHALHQDRCAGLKFRVGVFTNLTGDHLDYHGTMENYAASKAVLFEMLPADGLAIVNIDDPWHERMIQGCRAPVLGCTVKGQAQTSGRYAGGVCSAKVLGMSMSGMDVEFAGPWGVVRERLGLVGEYNVMNALQAFAAAWRVSGELKIDGGQLGSALARASAPPGRLEPVTVSGGGGKGGGYAVFVDYAHTDDALAKVLGVVRPLVGAGGRLIVVFGCGGDRDRTKRPRMGAAAGRLADVVIVTSDNPRTEQPSAIIDQILAGVSDEHKAKVHVHADRERAIHAAVEMARRGDIVVIAGKGHEKEQILPDGAGGTVRRHFDDVEVSRAAMMSRG